MYDGDGLLKDSEITRYVVASILSCGTFQTQGFYFSVGQQAWWLSEMSSLVAPETVSSTSAVSISGASDRHQPCSP